MKKFIGIKNGDGVIDRLLSMGYPMVYYTGDWIFIVIENISNFGKLILNPAYGLSRYDMEVDIDDVPLRKDLKEWVKMYKEGIKMGLL